MFAERAYSARWFFGLLTFSLVQQYKGGGTYKNIVRLWLFSFLPMLYLEFRTGSSNGRPDLSPGVLKLGSGKRGRSIPGNNEPYYCLLDDGAANGSVKIYKGRNCSLRVTRKG